MWKLTRPYHGPYRVVSLTPSNAEVVLIDKPKNASIFVALSRVRRCYEEMRDDTWTGPKRKRGGQQAKKQVEAPAPESSDAPLHPRQGPITRSRV